MTTTRPALQPALFQDPSSETSALGVYLVTNRYNLVEFLSSGLLLPAAGIPKYYADVSATCQGRLALFTAPLPAEALTAAVAPEDVGSFAVVLELDASEFDGAKAPALLPGGKEKTLPIGSAPGLAWAPPGILPLSIVRRIHFRSDQDLEEHNARRYENVFESIVASVVTPLLFDEPESVAVTDWLAKLPASADPNSESIRRADRVAGALALLGRVLPASQSVVEQFATTVAAGPTKARKPSKSKKRTSRANAPATGIPRSIPRYVIGENATKEDSLDTRLFFASADTLSSANPRERWRPLELLDAIETEASKELGDADRAELTRQFDGIRGILRQELEFRPFSPNKGLASTKALLMVLMRHVPSKLLEWERSESGADSEVMMMAAFLCGLVNGHKRLPISLRSPILDRALARQSAAVLTEWLPSASCEWTVVEKDTSARHGVIELTIDGEVALSIPKEPPALEELLATRGYNTPTEQAIGLAIVAEIGWQDCIVSSVTVSTGAARIARDKKGLVIECQGPVRVEQRLLVDVFRERLRSGIPRDRVDVIRSLIKRGSADAALDGA